MKQYYTNTNSPVLPQGLNTIHKKIAAGKALSRAFKWLDILEQSDDDNTDNENDSYNTPFADVVDTIVSSPHTSGLYIFSQAIIKCIPLILGFAQIDQICNKARLPCSKALQWWLDKFDIVLGLHKLRKYPNIEFMQASYMEYVKQESINCNHEFFIQQYL